MKIELKSTLAQQIFCICWYFRRQCEMVYERKSVAQGKEKKGEGQYEIAVESGMRQRDSQRMVTSLQCIWQAIKMQNRMTQYRRRLGGHLK